MKINELKAKKQQEFADKFLSVYDLRATMILATGIGKSRTTILILSELKDKFDKFLILVNSTKLRDTTWLEEIRKWNPELEDKVELETYQTAYKWKKKEKSLDKYFVVADEIDFAITEEYGKFFKEYNDIPTLGLTGYIAEYKRGKVDYLLPIIVEYTNAKAVDDGILNPYKFVFIRFNLSNSKFDIKIKFKDRFGVTKQFTQSENKAYIYWEKAVNKAQIEYNDLLAQSFIGLVSNEELTKAEKKLQAAINKRKNLLYSLNSSAYYTRAVKSKILEKETNKVVIFSKLTEQSKKVSPYTYHGKNTKKVNETNFNAFNEGEIRELAVVDKLNRGVNMVGLNYLILESYNSSDTDIVQKVGRSQRLDTGQIAHIVVLLPYYINKDEKGEWKSYPTQAVKWAEKMLKNFDTSNAIENDLRRVK